MNETTSQINLQENEPADNSRRIVMGSVAMLGVSALASVVSGSAVAAAADHAQPKPKPAMKPVKMKPVKLKTAPKISAGEQAMRTNDISLLNAALLLEHLELSFYTQVTAADTADQYLRGRLREILPSILQDETTHVALISTAITGLGGKPIDAPTFSFPQEVFISPLTYARFAYTLEEIGVGAYLGALKSFQSDHIRGAAAAIYGNETRHAALLRLMNGHEFSPRFYESPLTFEQVSALIIPYMIATPTA